MKLIRVIKKEIEGYKRFSGDIIWKTLQTISKAIITFLIFNITAGTLSQQDFGLYNYLLTLTSFFLMFGDFGISTSISKYVAEYNVKDKDKLNSIVFSSLIIFLIFSVLISIVGYILNCLYFKEDLLHFSLLIPLIFLMGGLNIFDGINRGLKKFKKLAYISIISGVFSLPFIFLLIEPYGIIGALMVQIIFYGIHFFILLSTSKHIKFLFDFNICKKIFNYALIIGFASLAYFFYINIDILFLESYGFLVEIGYYQIINYLFTFIFIPFSIIGQVIAPYITELRSQGNFDEIKTYFYRLFWFFIIGIFMSIALYYTFPLIIDVLFKKYLDKKLISILIILLVLIPFKTSGIVLTQGFIVPSGCGYITTFLTLIGGIFNTFLDLIMIQLYGFYGVFYATILVHPVTIILNFIMFYRFLNKTSKFPQKTLQKGLFHNLKTK